MLINISLKALEHNGCIDKVFSQICIKNILQKFVRISIYHFPLDR